jgi:hypothetical protein
MVETPRHQLENAEIQLVLQSGLFAKAPRLETFFKYICERHLEGKSEQIKEYSIATEALGRPSEFDPKKDSIVRVEAHRLRRRLEEYYAGPGADHTIRISIPNGQYRPQFLLKHQTPETSIEPVGASALVTVPDSVAPIVVRQARFWRASNPGVWILSLASIGVIALGARLTYSPHIKAAGVPETAEEVWKGSIEGFQNSAQIRLLTGYYGQAVVDRQGHKWNADAYFKGGKSSSLKPDRLSIAPEDAQFLRAQRSGKFEYQIPLRQTTYELHLYMLEVEYGLGNPKGPGEPRTFRVLINGSSQRKELDPLADTGGSNRLYERVFKDVTPASDGLLHLSFEPGTGPAFLNAIELMPSPHGRIHPVRIVAQDNPITDSEGRFWSADQYYSGGTAVCRRTTLTNSEDSLFHGERYGNFSYRIPVAHGKYRLSLHFAETWFGTPESHAPAEGSRIFNVFVNGVALLRNYQVVQDAGSPNREVTKVFDNLEPNAQGVLLIEFVPVENYAEVNAIEVVATS